MTEKEFIEKAKEEGQTDEQINAVLQLREKEIQAGLKPLPFEFQLVGELLSDPAFDPKFPK